MYDFVRGAKTTGRKFYFNIGTTAIEELNHILSMINYHTERGYTFVMPPLLISKNCATQAGILPRFDGDFYETLDGLILIPTAETPLVGMHSHEIIEEDSLPLKYVAFSPCFRREAGSYGDRDKGLRRVHQFHKIELFIICRPQDSLSLHKEMVFHVEGMLRDLYPQLKYRTILLDEKDRSPVSVETFDIELQCKDEWLEVSSISNTGENQTKLAQVRYRPKSGGKVRKCHMLNGSGVALPRLIVALENST